MDMVESSSETNRDEVRLSEKVNHLVVSDKEDIWRRFQRLERTHTVFLLQSLVRIWYLPFNVRIYSTIWYLEKAFVQRRNSRRLKV